MKVEPTALPEVLLILPRVFGDARGKFLETYSASRYAEAGIDVPFVQDNVSVSAHGVVRGLHLQHPDAQAKLVQVVRGEILDVAVDVRPGSPHFGQHVGARLSAENHRQLFIPPGHAHGFCVLSDEAVVSYKCSDYYAPGSELTVRWDDPALGIEWPVSAPVVSDRDGQAPCLGDIDPSRLPPYEPRRDG